MDRICAHCRYWLGNKPEYPAIMGRGVYRDVAYYPCAKRGVDLEDNGKTLVLVSGQSDCKGYGQCFEPTKEYLEEYTAQCLEDQEDEAKTYGLTAGVDYPATLHW